MDNYEEFKKNMERYNNENKDIYEYDEDDSTQIPTYSHMQTEYSYYEVKRFIYSLNLKNKYDTLKLINKIDDLFKISDKQIMAEKIFNFINNIKLNASDRV